MPGWIVIAVLTVGVVMILFAIVLRGERRRRRGGREVDSDWDSWFGDGDGGDGGGD